jgi:hypothetical protein
LCGHGWFGFERKVCCVDVCLKKELVCRWKEMNGLVGGEDNRIKRIVEVGLGADIV